MDYEKLPKELTEKREVIECNFVLSLYKDVTLVDDYKNVVNGEDILTEDGMYYYGLIQNLRRAGYSVADNMSIYEYLEDKKTLKKEFEKRGGFGSIQEITGLLTLENLDVYYDELCKSNLLIRLHDKGFNVLQNLNMFKEMSAEEVYDYMEFQLADTSVGKIDKSQVVDLTKGYDAFIKEWDEGNDVGFKIGLSMLNYQLLGIHKKHLMLHLAGIGQGKTTTAIAWYVIPAIKNGDSVTIIANEQGESEWRQMLLSTIIFNEINRYVKGLDRHKMIIGNFTQEQKDIMYEAENWLSQQPGKVYFIDTQDYDVKSIKKHIARQSKLGCGLFIIDTMKITDDLEKAWAVFSEAAKGLFLAAKKYDVAIVATMQLSPEAMQRKYLDLTCIGKSKATAETASTVVMFRSLARSEKEKIEAYEYDKDNRKIKRNISLDPDKDYIMIFTPKNRYGNISPQIIVERNMSFNSYKQIGWYECEFDQFRTR